MTASVTSPAVLRTEDRIRDVYAANLAQEMARIRVIVQEYPVSALSALSAAPPRG